MLPKIKAGKTDVPRRWIAQRIHKYRFLLIGLTITAIFYWTKDSEQDAPERLPFKDSSAIRMTEQIRNLRPFPPAAEISAKAPKPKRETNTDQAQYRKLISELIKNGGQIDQENPEFVDYVKNEMLEPPSLLSYSLENPGQKNPSQMGQNVYVLAILQQKRNGFFIECGAADGEYLSNTLMLEREFGWTGLLIEASPALAQPLRNKHRKAWTSSACLSTKKYPQMLDLFIDKSGINSLLKSSEGMKKLHGFAPKTGDGTPVLCIPLYTYLLALGITTVDYFSLDVEGADLDVLRTIPFDKVVFRVLEVEVHVLNEGSDAVRRFMESKGYILLLHVYPDYIFVHPSTLSELKSS